MAKMVLLVFVIGVLVIITDQIREEMLGSVVGRIS